MNNSTNRARDRRIRKGLVFGCLWLVSFGAVAATAAGEHLSFETVADGKCHILSEGGKLVLLKNNHPSKSVRYRLERLFAGRPQSLMDGVISPKTEAQKLGCDTVGGRPQRWRVKRATFAPE